ncbi:hypothetical protein HELRODRAFT_176857 [Helobdella robusta]|uniref:Uncharacterized protein n=1 Tax=Helobdella robusta TaxID=6412 RepID=T1FAZ5_HELRO|nr:hypothetical protein HELRODRAFT_176857 [Helobdella robusta]ESN98397.1 hypothetical protein HELRODRAFT_176857 [Helobdella robusta]
MEFVAISLWSCFLLVTSSRQVEVNVILPAVSNHVEEMTETSVTDSDMNHMKDSSKEETSTKTAKKKISDIEKPNKNVNRNMNILTTNHKKASKTTSNITNDQDPLAATTAAAVTSIYSQNDHRGRNILAPTNETIATKPTIGNFLATNYIIAKKLIGRNYNSHIKPNRSIHNSHIKHNRSIHNSHTNGLQTTTPSTTSTTDFYFHFSENYLINRNFVQNKPAASPNPIQETESYLFLYLIVGFLLIALVIGVIFCCFGMKESDKALARGHRTRGQENNH